MHNRTTFLGWGRTTAVIYTSLCPRLLLRCVVAVLVWSGALHGGEADAHRGWRIYGGDAAGAKYSSLTQINRENVHRLRPAWIYRSGDDISNSNSTIECNPIVVDGIVYLTTPGLKLAALDASSGRPRWIFDPWEGAGGRGVNRGVAYWTDGGRGRILYVAGNYLHAVDARTGRLIESFGQGGKVDFRKGLDRDTEYRSVTATSPGVVFRDLFIVGSASGESPRSAPGHIRAYDVRTGERRWIFHTIPHPGEFGHDTWPSNAWKMSGGANCWGGMTVDAERGLVFAGTGSPTYDAWGGDRIGQNLFGNTVLALRADTGERVWHFQVVHHDLWDYDIPCAPNLVTVEHGGRRIDGVAQVTKMGHLFLLERETGRPLFPVEERPVPKSDVPGEQSWPTQPIPTKPRAFAQQRFTVEEATDLNPAANAAVRQRLAAMRTGDTFLPPGITPSVVLPQFNGGAEWGGAAFDPTSRTLYVNSSSEAEWTSMRPSKPPDSITLGELGRQIYTSICATCHGGSAASLPGAPSFAALDAVRERLTRAQVLELLETGRNQMPSFASFTATEKRAVVAHLFGEGGEERVPAAELTANWAGGIPWTGSGHHPFRDPDGFPANRRPWGTITAIALDTGEFRWQVPLGTYPELEKRGEPPTGTFNMGGCIVTAGGLVFTGAAADERLHAYDKDTGKLLWEYQLEAGGYALPATYEIDGRQYLLIAAGGGGKVGTKPGDAYYCFALP